MSLLSLVARGKADRLGDSAQDPTHSNHPKPPSLKCPKPRLSKDKSQREAARLLSKAQMCPGLADSGVAEGCWVCGLCGLFGFFLRTCMRRKQ